MEPKNMVCNLAVALFVNVIGNNEEKIKTGEKRVGESDIFMWVFMDIVLHRDVKTWLTKFLTTTYLSIYGVSSGDDATPSI